MTNTQRNAIVSCMTGSTTFSTKDSFLQTNPRASTIPNCKCGDVILLYDVKNAQVGISTKPLYFTSTK